MGKQAWTKEQEEYIRNLYNSNVSIKEITKLLNTKFSACYDYDAVKRKICNSGISRKVKNANSFNLNVLNNNRKERVGQTKVNIEGSPMTIIEYIDANHITVEFEDFIHYKTNSTYSCFKKGQIKNYGRPFLYNRGYIGQGDYQVSIDGVATKAYDMWRKMFDRCYNKKLHDKYKTYEKCEVCNEWYCFQNFAQWFYDNFYNIDNETMELDKDWLKIGNKLYCPEFCCIVPKSLNCCLSFKPKHKYTDLPNGVSKLPSGKYRASIQIGECKIHIGTFSNSKDAEDAYWDYKISSIKKKALLYKEQIPKQLYDALLNYEFTCRRRYDLYKQEVMFNE